MLCQDCDKRNTCVSLCPAAEAYVNQDHVTHEELYISTQAVDTMLITPNKINLSDFQSLTVFHTRLSRLEGIVLSMILCGVEREEIQKELSITRKRYNNILHRIRQKVI